jgi:hypothetical protein
MKRLLMGTILVAMTLAAAGRHSQAQMQPDLSDHHTVMIMMLGALQDARQQGDISANVELIRRVGDSGDTLYIAPLLDLGYFARFGDSETELEVFNALQRLTGQAFGARWQEYFEWASANDVPLPPGYDEFKGAFLGSFVDPEFQRFFAAGVQDTAQVNMLELVWGGVRVDGIPSLVNSPQISPEEATAEGQRFTQYCRDDDCSYPASDELVFGVSIDGDNRAYPLRLLNWHEMFNDYFGKAPLFDAPDGESVCDFRAPTPFAVLARDGEHWLQIEGQSAGCPAGGWIERASIEWLDTDWDAAQEAIPDLGAGASPLENNEDAPAARVMGRPVMLAYCTLCGSGVLYDTMLPDLVVSGESLGPTALEFGSTGLLMRSNKVMYDRNTQTAWNAMTGTPAFGPLAGTDIELALLPVVVTDWATWLEEHPDTSVLSLDTGFRRDYTNGAAYGDYFNDPNFLMFPVWQQDTSEQDNKEVVFTMLIDGTPIAYPLETIIPERVTNDTVAGLDVVIVSRQTPEREFFEPGGAAVRAYERDGHTFSPGEGASSVIDENGAEWTLTEDALINADGEALARLPGHLAFWFGWYGYYEDTLVYEGVE